MESCPFGIVSIRDGVHLGWYPFGIVSIRGCAIRDSVHSGLSPFGIVSIQDRVQDPIFSIKKVLSFIFISPKQYLPAGSTLKFPKSIFIDSFTKTATPFLSFSQCEKKNNLPSHSHCQNFSLLKNFNIVFILIATMKTIWKF